VATTPSHSAFSSPPLLAGLLVAHIDVHLSRRQTGLVSNWAHSHVSVVMLPSCRGWIHAPLLKLTIYLRLLFHSQSGAYSTRASPYVLKRAGMSSTSTFARDLPPASCPKSGSTTSILLAMIAWHILDTWRGSTTPLVSDTVQTTSFSYIQIITVDGGPRASSISSLDATSLRVTSSCTASWPSRYRL
jgi:hypothetical protein